MSKLNSKKSGMASHGATVALTPARALTSHLRRHYENRYRGRYRFAPWVFALDLFLVACIVVFAVIISVTWFGNPANQPKIGLYLSAPTLQTGAPVALEAKVVSRDTVAHPNMRLAWYLPPNTEIVSAQPPLTDQNETYLGDLQPGQYLNSRLVVRLFTPPSQATLSFRVKDDNRLWLGAESRQLAGSALHLESLVTPTAMTSETVWPFSLVNSTVVPFDQVEIVVTGAALDARAGQPAQTVAAFQNTPVLVRPSANQKAAIQVKSRGVVLQKIDLPALSSGSVPVRDFSLSAVTPGQPVSLSVRADAPAKLLVYLPSMTGAVNGARIFDLSAGQQVVNLPVESQARAMTAASWFAIPFTQTASGTVIGQIRSAAITTPFDLQAAVRYYAATGDQLGVGPLPPRVNQTTKYWASWKLAPTASDLSNLTVRAILPVGVKLTGRTALPNGGDIKQEGNEAVWSLPSAPASPDGLTASFEISLTPSYSQRNTLPKLLQTSTATATEIKSNSVLRATTPAVDTSLPDDPKAANKGRVK